MRSRWRFATNARARSWAGLSAGFGLTLTFALGLASGLTVFFGVGFFSGWCLPFAFGPPRSNWYRFHCFIRPMSRLEYFGSVAYPARWIA